MYQIFTFLISQPKQPYYSNPNQMQCLFSGPRSAVGIVSAYRCKSDFRSRGASSIPALSHTSLEIDHEIISTVILLPSAESFKKGCCQIQAKVCARNTG